MIGKIFNDLTVIGQYETYISPHGKKATQWLCKCKCGNTTVVRRNKLVGNYTKSCGCKQFIGLPNNKTHGLSKNNIYAIWSNMKARCNNPKHEKFKDYGGRGIKVCKEWNDSFINFLNDMGFQPNKSYSIDRIDVDGNYCPENCKWSTPLEQSKNKRIHKEFLSTKTS